MITPEMIGQFMGMDIGKTDTKHLVDINALKFDNSLSKEKRISYIIKELQNPFCFRCGNMGIQIEFDDNAPPMDEVFTNFLIRKKSGL